MTKARDLANASTALSAVSATELGYVDGVTSAIQTQMDAKAPSSTAVTLTGTQTLTNKTLTSPALTTPTISTATTNGDILYGTGSGALARLGIGTTGQVLTVASGIPSWATASSGGYTQLATGSLSGSSISLTSISQDYRSLVLYLQNTSFSGAAGLRFTFNSNTNSIYGYTYIQNGTSTGSGSGGLAYGYLGDFPGYQDSTSLTMTIPNYTYSASRPHWHSYGGQYPANGGHMSILSFGALNSGGAVTSLQLFPSAGTFSTGTYYLFGVK